MPSRVPVKPSECPIWTGMASVSSRDDGAVIGFHVLKYMRYPNAAFSPHRDPVDSLRLLLTGLAESTLFGCAFLHFGGLRASGILLTVNPWTAHRTHQRENIISSGADG
jgi:hypothetical protein